MRTILSIYLLFFSMGSALSQNALPFEIERIASFNNPWAMTFLPDGDLLVTEKSGRLLMMDHDGNNMIEVTGVPSVAYDGQGGLGDVTLHPEYAKNKMLYLSFAEADEDDKDKKGAAVIRAKLTINNNKAELSEIKYIWRQIPKVTGSGHYGHRIEFSRDGFLYISSGDRQNLIQHKT